MRVPYFTGVRWCHGTHVVLILAQCGPCWNARCCSDHHSTLAPTYSHIAIYSTLITFDDLGILNLVHEDRRHSFALSLLDNEHHLGVVRCDLRSDLDQVSSRCAAAHADAARGRLSEDIHIIDLAQVNAVDAVFVAAAELDRAAAARRHLLDSQVVVAELVDGGIDRAAPEAGVDGLLGVAEVDPLLILPKDLHAGVEARLASQVGDEGLDAQTISDDVDAHLAQVHVGEVVGQTSRDPVRDEHLAVLAHACLVQVGGQLRGIPGLERQSILLVVVRAVRLLPVVLHAVAWHVACPRA
mmetsp:Transcript_9830/g.26818  ORF Transcript_9830/g.26818 Transcript_9830/m.26818 type:complete len:298 (-) Transcript_9830:101-994(-)